jgi:hypothetical protein
MKKKPTNRKTRKTKAPRATVAKRIRAAVANGNDSEALNLALYGEDAKGAIRLNSSAGEVVFRPDQAWVSQFIQGWLFLKDSKSDLQSNLELLTFKHSQLRKEMVNYFDDPLERGDWEFFQDFANRLKSEVRSRDAAMLKNRLPIYSELLVSKSQNKAVNLSKLAKKHNVATRSVWEINRNIGAKTLSRGRPRK